MCLDEKVVNRWGDDREILWSEIYFPHDITELPLASNNNDTTLIVLYSQRTTKLLEFNWLNNLYNDSRYFFEFISLQFPVFYFYMILVPSCVSLLFCFFEERCLLKFATFFLNIWQKVFSVLTKILTSVRRIDAFNSLT